MWRLFSRILLLSLLQYATMAEKIEDCPPHSVCTIWGKFKCERHSANQTVGQWGGFIYQDQSSCTDFAGKRLPDYAHPHYARFDLRPLTIHEWSFNLIHWDRRIETDPRPEERDDGSTDNQRLNNIGFEFGYTSRITFPDTQTVKFEWRKSDKSPWNESATFDLHHVKEFNEEPKKEFFYDQYTFNISSKENLFSHFGRTPFKFLRFEDPAHPGDMFFYDDRFVDWLGQMPPCNPDDLKTICRGSCQPMPIEKTNMTTEAFCDSIFWFHNTDDATFTREWRAVEEVKCTQGSWEAVWNGGSQMLDSKYEVQCAAQAPAKMTDQTYAAMGFGIFLLVIAVGLVAFFAWRLNRRRVRRNYAKSHSDAPTFSTPSTPGGGSHRPTPPPPPPRPDA